MPLSCPAGTPHTLSQLSSTSVVLLLYPFAYLPPEPRCFLLVSCILLLALTCLDHCLGPLADLLLLMLTRGPGALASPPPADTHPHILLAGGRGPGWGPGPTFTAVVCLRPPAYLVGLLPWLCPLTESTEEASASHFCLKPRQPSQGGQMLSFHEGNAPN